MPDARRPRNTLPPVTIQDVSLRSVALPREHGGWSLTLEPAVLGLLVEPSTAGALLALAALLAFLARTPAELVLVDRYRERSHDRTRLAVRLTLGYTAVLALLIVAASALADGPFWIPVLVAVPFFALDLGYARRSRSRRLVPELAGSVAIGAVAPAIALAGGSTMLVAGGLWLVIAARVVAAIPFVRVQLRRFKAQPFVLAGSDGAQVGAVAVAALGLALVGVPLSAAVAVAFMAAVHLVEVRLPPRRAPIIGAQQVVLGLTVVLATGLGYLAP